MTFHSYPRVLMARKTSCIISQGRDCERIPRCHLKRFDPAATAAPAASADAAVETEVVPHATAPPLALAIGELVMAPLAPPVTTAPVTPSAPEVGAEDPV